MTGDRLTVAVVTPHAAPGPEVELPAMSGGRVATIVCRTQPSAPLPPNSQLGHAELQSSTETAAIDRAAVALAGRTLDAVAHASTTSGYHIGPLEEAALIARLSEWFEVPAVASCASAAAAFQAHGARHVQLVHPPWFDDEFDQLGAEYFRRQGFDAVVTRAVGLPGDPAAVEPQLVIDWVEHHLDNRAEAIYLAGNGFRAAAAVEELELRTGRLVVAANQALLWSVMESTGVRWGLSGYGRLLRA